MPIPMACLRLFTGRRPPDFNSPCLNSCITLPTFFDAFLLKRRALAFLRAPGRAEERVRAEADFVLRWLAERFALARFRPVLLREVRDDDVARALEDLRLVIAIF